MTTTIVEVSKDLPKPGTIVLVRGLSDFKSSSFGIVATVDFWNEYASQRAKQSFSENKSPVIPVLEMDNNFNWGLYFTQANNVICHKSILYDCADCDSWLSMFYTFTLRDGSRYYKIFYEQIDWFHDFLIGKKDINKYPAFDEDKTFIVSLIKWREENKKDKVVSGLSSEGELFEVVSDHGDDTHVVF